MTFKILNWQYWVFLTNLEILFNLLPGQILTSFDNECLLMLRHKTLDSSCRLRIQGEERNYKSKTLIYDTNVWYFNLVLE